MDHQVVGLLVPLGVFAMVVAIVWLVSREKQAKSRHRAEVQKELIAKFASGGDLAEFLNSEGSRRLFESSKSQEDPKQKVLGLLTGGVICLSLGGAFFALVAVLGTEGLMVPAALLSAIGVGLLAAAAINHALAKKWGMLESAGHGEAPKAY